MFSVPLSRTGHIAGDGFGSRDRFGEGLPYPDQLGGFNQLERLAAAAEHLVEPTTDVGTEAQRQRCPRCRGEFADTIKPEPAQPVDHGCRQAQRGHRQHDQRLIGAFADRGDRRTVACQRMRGAVGAGNGRASRDSHHGKALDHVGK